MWKSALLFATLCLPVTAIAAPPMSCSPRPDVLSQLAQKFKEAPVAVGLANNGGLLEGLTNGTGATWTIIITMPHGGRGRRAGGGRGGRAPPPGAPARTSRWSDAGFGPRSGGWRRSAVRGQGGVADPVAGLDAEPPGGAAVDLEHAARRFRRLNHLQ